jgi:hypothetical protein
MKTSILKISGLEKTNNGLVRKFHGSVLNFSHKLYTVKIWYANGSFVAQISDSQNIVFYNDKLNSVKDAVNFAQKKTFIKLK